MTRREIRLELRGLLGRPGGLLFTEGVELPRGALDGARLVLEPEVAVVVGPGALLAEHLVGLGEAVEDRLHLGFVRAQLLPEHGVRVEHLRQGEVRVPDVLAVGVALHPEDPVVVEEVEGEVQVVDAFAARGVEVQVVVLVDLLRVHGDGVVGRGHGVGVDHVGGVLVDLVHLVRGRRRGLGLGVIVHQILRCVGQRGGGVGQPFQLGRSIGRNRRRAHGLRRADDLRLVGLFGVRLQLSLRLGQQIVRLVQLAGREHAPRVGGPRGHAGAAPAGVDAVLTRGDALVDAVGRARLGRRLHDAHGPTAAAVRRDAERGRHHDRARRSAGGRPARRPRQADRLAGPLDRAVLDQLAHDVGHVLLAEVRQIAERREVGRAVDARQHEPLQRRERKLGEIHSGNEPGNSGALFDHGDGCSGRSRTQPTTDPGVAGSECETPVTLQKTS